MSNAVKGDRIPKWELTSEVFAWFVLASALVAIVPLFLRMATWGDTTLFDLAARSLLRKGHFYDEVFTHGPPGMIWFQAAVRSLVGWSSVALRAADFVIFTAVVWFLARGTQPQGLSRAASVWIAAALYLCYFSATEWSHCQTDGWLLLPSLGALCLRQRQAAALVGFDTAARVLAWRALAEGVLWGTAFVMKPFVLVSAIPCLLLVWLPAFGGLRKRGALRRLACDAGGILAGGLLVGGAAVAALYLTGDWSEFLASTFGSWNKDYAALTDSWWGRTVTAFVDWPRPWKALHGLAIPVALLLIGRSLWVRTRPADAAAGWSRLGLLAAFYLGSFLQANYLQIQFEYQTLPALLLAWAVVLGAFAWLSPRAALAGALPAAVLALAVYNHPLLTANRLALWADCWKPGDSDRLKDALAVNKWGGHTSWLDLRGAALFLQTHGARDREVTCLHWSAIPLYTELGIEPSNRFVFPWTRMGFFPSFKQTIWVETMRSPQRFVVVDLWELGQRESTYRTRMMFPPGALDPFGPRNPLPERDQWEKPGERGVFDPFKPRGLYHSGRYAVLELAPPPGADNKPG
jgi:hypothetical protein